MADETLPERESMAVDVVIVGAGPAGLAAAIRLKQRAPQLGVVVLEKGAEVGAHILSGAVIDPIGLDRLLPGWRGEDHPLGTPVTEDRFLYLTARKAFALPQALLPPLLRNEGNFIASLGQVCRWLAKKAEALGVEIYPGFAATEALFDAGGRVVGVATGDFGRRRDGTRGPDFARGMALFARYTLLAEGARGSLAKTLIARFGLQQGREPQKFGLGIKELWRVEPARHRPGRVQHSLGWPLDDRTGGGSFLYHLADGKVAVGFITHLDYANPHLSPYGEFQRFKTHPAIAPLFEGASRLAYGARAVTEGGWQSVPKLVFPGGALIGCAAGFMNVPRIKGSHNAVLSGINAADVVAGAIAAGRAHDELADYETGWRGSPIGRDLRPARNMRPLLGRFGTRLGMGLAGAEMWAGQLGLSLFGTLRHGRADHEALRPAAASAPIDYPPPDGRLSFDRLDSVFFSNTRHNEDQPPHLKIGDQTLQVASEHDIYGGPSARYCPAGVYDWVEAPEGARLVIHAGNCVHCKSCDIKDPNQNIDWVPPEGGGGPNYAEM